jgi:hypothetical protein
MYLREINFKDIEWLRIDYDNMFSQYREGGDRRRTAPFRVATV